MIGAGYVAAAAQLLSVLAVPMFLLPLWVLGAAITFRYPHVVGRSASQRAPADRALGGPQRVRPRFHDWRRVPSNHGRSGSGSCACWSSPGASPTPDEAVGCCPRGGLGPVLNA
jgi:hypothetical protein